MAFAYTVAKKGVVGDLRYVMVNFTNAGAGTGGVVTKGSTGLKYVYYANATTETTQAANTNLVEKNTGGAGPQNGSVKITTVASESGTVFMLGV